MFEFCILIQILFFLLYLIFLMYLTLLLLLCLNLFVMINLIILMYLFLIYRVLFILKVLFLLYRVFLVINFILMDNRFSTYTFYFHPFNHKLPHISRSFLNNIIKHRSKEDIHIVCHIFINLLFFLLNIF